jgi:hypothetical protein
LPSLTWAKSARSIVTRTPRVSHRPVGRSASASALSAGATDSHRLPGSAFVEVSTGAAPQVRPDRQVTILPSPAGAGQR